MGTNDTQIETAEGVIGAELPWDRLSSAQVVRLVEALRFYADPGTYLAIGFLPDPPCGDLMEDFSETELGRKPGKLARQALQELECDY